MGPHMDERDAVGRGPMVIEDVLDLPDAPRDTPQAEDLALELFVAGYEGTRLPDAYAERLARGLAGVILFARNLERDPAGLIDLQSLTAHTASVFRAATSGARPQPTPICSVDQEGGAVARLRAPMTRFPPMAEVAERADLALTRRVGLQTGLECLAAGFNVDFAPVLDIDTNPANPIIGSRAFGRTPEAVIAHGGAFLEGLQRSGVLGCGKHFPGHGDTDTDSHLALPVLPFDRSRLEAVELAPFRALAPRLSLVMTAHILFPALDAQRPATLSRAILQDLLRGHCGYEGLVVSDDLEMKGVAEAFSYAECVREGLRAGVELFLVCRREDALMEAVHAVAEELLAGGEVALDARRAIGRVRSLRTRLARPEPSAAGIARATESSEARTLRSTLGVGTV